MTSLRIFTIGGAIAYRALFNWVSPWIYIPTLLGGPIFQILFFSYLGRYSGFEDDAFFVVGNGVQICAMTSVYGATMAIANERWFGTLSALLATPASRFALFLGRAVPFIVNGIFVSTFGLVLGWALLDFSPALSSLPALALVLLVTVSSCTAFGLLLGSIGLRARDVFFASNLAYFLMLLFCGVNIPLSDLPGWMGAIGRVLPVTHGIEAARGVAAGEGLGDVATPLLAELGIGAAYAVAAYGLFRFFEADSRRRASLETV
ncbi:MAG: ABC transporter permease [Actinobacteria bacterium]|nr:MAG: ABC transporter permease [Actinomycetota bacterium]